MWKCSKCGEEIEDQYDKCWQCAGEEFKNADGISATCYNHPDIYSTGTCHWCGRDLCTECLDFSDPYGSCKDKKESRSYQHDHEKDETQEVERSDAFASIMNYDQTHFEGRMSDILRYFRAEDFMTSHLQFVTSIKRKVALKYMGICVILIVVGISGFIYGLVDVIGKAVLPGNGALFLLGGPIAILAGVFHLIASSARLASASKSKMYTSLEEACRQFYLLSFCKKVGDLTEREDHIIEACELFPVPILEYYKKRGWIVFEAMLEEEIEGTQPLECCICHKKVDSCKESHHTIPILIKHKEAHRHEEDAETRKLMDALFVKCEYCKSVFYYKCISLGRPKEIRYLCPFCGMATNGFDGLGRRWNFLRESFVGEDIKLKLINFSIEQKKRDDVRIVDILVNLSCTPSLSVRFKNVAFNINGTWLLATPEPVKANPEDSLP